MRKDKDYEESYEHLCSNWFSDNHWIDNRDFFESNFKTPDWDSLSKSIKTYVEKVRESVKKEEMKKKLHKAIEDSLNPRHTLHEMYKQKMKDIVSDAIFCYLMLDQVAEQPFTREEELKVMDHIMGFSDRFIEENCTME